MLGRYHRNTRDTKRGFMDFMSVSDIIVLLFPVIVFLILWSFRWLEQRLPEKQREALDQFARYAVRKIEQQYSDWSGDKKKSYAETIVINLFKDMHLPVPSYALVDAAIEAVVFELNQLKLPRIGVNTGPIKAVPPPEGGQPA